MKKRRIAILFHQLARYLDLRTYAITFLADVWREQGHEVLFLFGCREFVPADLVIVHVDLTVVPDEYFELADRYPVALNGNVRDIRKSTFSSLRLDRTDTWQGQVIVKSNLNAAGVPEKIVRWSRFIHPSVIFAVGRTMAPLHSWKPFEYPIYDSLADVPRRYFDDDRFIVEKFLPETGGGTYMLRSYLFLGDAESWFRFHSTSKIVKASNEVSREVIPPDSRVQRLRESMGFDYGKFDYVVHNDEPILLDCNRTVGAGSPPYPEEILEMRRARARGLDRYLS